MNEFKIQETLEDFLNAAAYDTDCEVVDIANVDRLEDCSVKTFREAGLLTNDNGLVVRTKDGEEFVITIQKR